MVTCLSASDFAFNLCFDADESFTNVCANIDVKYMTFPILFLVVKLKMVLDIQPIIVQLIKDLFHPH